MQIIPVIDLSKGIVVHAVKGNRNEYRAIDSKLCSSPKPYDVISAFLELFDFNSIYIADLDALEQQGDHVKIIETICLNYPDLEIWLDTGTKLLDRYLQNATLSNLRLILSSESLASAEVLDSFINEYSAHNFILSLDFKNDHLLGPQELLQEKHRWPEDIIVLNLNNVGSEQGNKIPTQINQLDMAENFNIYYGGGISNCNDINELKSHKYTGALVSTSLHKQLITEDDLISFTQLP